ncbi:glycosyltransferase [Williamsia deligens]|uniref:Glycosyltransferase n=1 Tax=Williamsia deligens TaxID=321325 RepID=A0ABW3G7E0_9NOCA|nr:glycosyltransferase [Williamsia deligens]
MATPLRIAVLASSSFPIEQPFAGGLEAHVYNLSRALRDRGHQVSLFAAPGSSLDRDTDVLPVHTLDLSPASLVDPVMTPTAIREHHAYLGVMMDLAGELGESFDIIHNHSLHYLPPAMSATLPMPMITTLHTPPVPWLESAIALAPRDVNTFAAVSAFNAREWATVVPDAAVIRNGIPLEDWPEGPGGDSAVWSGRITPEKGTHLAIDAARRAGIHLRVAGPVYDPEYFDAQVAPRLGDSVEYVGHLGRADLARLVGSSSVALVTPVWAEPYGLVVAEALACGTPVAAFSRGGIPEIVDDECGVLAPADDVDALAAAIPRAARLSRSAARRRAETCCSSTRMVDAYEALYRRVLRRARLADTADVRSIA